MKLDIESKETRAKLGGIIQRAERGESSWEIVFLLSYLESMAQDLATMRSTVNTFSKHLLKRGKDERGSRKNSSSKD